jgi:hypothetical protein
MVKGEALLFLAGHFFSKYPFSSSRTDTAEKILKEASPIAITGFSNVLINVPCVYRGFFIYSLFPLKARLTPMRLFFLVITNTSVGICSWRVRSFAVVLLIGNRKCCTKQMKKKMVVLFPHPSSLLHAKTNACEDTGIGG